MSRPIVRSQNTRRDAHNVITRPRSRGTSEYLVYGRCRASIAMLPETSPTPAGRHDEGQANACVHVAWEFRLTQMLSSEVELRANET